MYFVYILQSNKDGSLYTGFTEDLDRRFKEHNEGLNVSTALLKPWTLIYYEAYSIKADALGREKFLKSGRGKSYLDHQLKNFFEKNPRKKTSELT
jgi:putative endonuclease